MVPSMVMRVLRSAELQSILVWPLLLRNFVDALSPSEGPSPTKDAMAVLESSFSLSPSSSSSSSPSTSSGWWSQIESLFVLVVEIGIALFKAALLGSTSFARAVSSNLLDVFSTSTSSSSSPSSSSLSLSSSNYALWSGTHSTISVMQQLKIAESSLCPPPPPPPPPSFPSSPCPSPSPCPSDAISRCLMHALSVLTELSANSDKYGFVRSLAERIVAENSREAHRQSPTPPASAARLAEDVNKKALAWAFARTSALLADALQSCCNLGGSSRWDAGGGGGGGMGGGMGGERGGGWQEIGGAVCGIAHNVLLRVETWTSTMVTGKKNVVGLGSSSPPSPAAIAERAEKFAGELAWLVDVMCKYCSSPDALEEVAAYWSREFRLADVANATCMATSGASLGGGGGGGGGGGAGGRDCTRVSSLLRVQRALVYVTTRLWRAVGYGDLMIPEEVRFGLVVLWLPLTCKSAPIAIPTMTSSSSMLISAAVGGVPSAHNAIGGALGGVGGGGGGGGGGVVGLGGGGGASAALEHAESSFWYSEVQDRREIMETDRDLDMVVRTLPAAEQEAVFRLWLQEFACSPYDRPNLTKAYELWRSKARQAAVLAAALSSVAASSVVVSEESSSSSSSPSSSSSSSSSPPSLSPA